MPFCLMTCFHGCLLLVSESACLSASFLGTWNAFSEAQPGPLMQFVPLLVFPANGPMVLTMEFLNPPPFIWRALHVGSRLSYLRNPFLNLLVHHLQVKWVNNISGCLDVHRLSRFQTCLLLQKNINMLQVVSAVKQEDEVSRGWEELRKLPWMETM